MMMAKGESIVENLAQFFYFCVIFEFTAFHNPCKDFPALLESCLELLKLTLKCFILFLQASQTLVLFRLLLLIFFDFLAATVLLFLCF
jgi:hypothetical protein